MARENIVKSALAGFFGTFTSRNSAWHGTWLLGHLLREADRAEWDLLQPPRAYDKLSAMDYAETMAAQKFQRQLAKVDATALVKEATLVLERVEDDGLLAWATKLGVMDREPYAIEVTATAVVTTASGESEKPFVISETFFVYRAERE
jgi:hypothetical protein